MTLIPRFTNSPFVGRERELTVLQTAWREAQAGQGRLVLLVGEPGIGKTRTVEEFATIARAQGGHVLWGRCYEGEGAPAFWPWVQALRAAMKPLDPADLRGMLSTDAAELVHLVPEIREQIAELPALEPNESPQARFRQFDSVTRFFGNLAQRTPLLVVLDDLQGADRSSLLLLEFMARALRDIPLLIVGTYRAVGTRVTPALTETLADLTREPTTERVVLAGLSAVEIAQLVQASAGVELTTALVTLLHQRTEGNPLFVREFVRVLAAEGRLHGGDQAAAIGVPQNVEAVIERRLSPLSAVHREILSVAAVVGREFAFQVLLPVLMIGALAGDVADAEVSALDALAEAEEAGLITRLPGSTRRYRFAHALFQETLYNSCSDRRRAQLHQQVGEALERLPDREEYSAELAHHFIQAVRARGQSGSSDDCRKAIQYARRAGDRALGLLAYEEAVRLYQMALDVMAHSGPADDAERCAVLVHLGVAQREACDLESSKATLLRASELAKRLGLCELLAHAALNFGTKVSWGQTLAPDHTLLALLETAIAAWEEADSTLHARLLARLVFPLRFSTDPERRRYMSRRALEMARRLDDSPVICEALHAWLAAHWAPGSLDERLARAEELARRAEQIHDLDLALLGHGWRFILLLERGNSPASQSALRTCEGILKRLPDPYHQWMRQRIGVALSIQEGRFAEAERLAPEFLALEQTINRGPPFGSFALMLALSCTRGDRDALERRFGSPRAPANNVLGLAFQCNVAYLARELEHTAEARAAFEALANYQFADLPQDEFWFMCMQQLAEVCAFLNDAARADLLAGLLALYETRAVIWPTQKVYFGPVSHSLGLLETILSRWDDASRHFEHALDMNRQMRARPWLARTQFEYARMLLARGHAADREPAQALRQEALATAQELGMPLLIERLQAMENSLQSTVHSRQASRASEDLPIADAQSAPRIPQSTMGAVFRREGDYWTIAHSGTEVRLKDTKGLQYLAYLLRHPGEEILAIDLAQSTENGDLGSAMRKRTSEPTPALSSPTPALDAQAKAAYKRRLEALRDELSEAEANNDIGRAEQARSEMDMLAEQLRGALGLGCRDRPVANDLERARSAVGKRIRAEIKRIRAAHPELGRHLVATVATGYFCVYDPGRDVVVKWEL